MEEALDAALEAAGAAGTEALAGVPARDTDLVGGACEGLAFFSAEGGAVEGVALLLGAGSASEIT